MSFLFLLRTHLFLTGYRVAVSASSAQSKWVVEKLCQIAARKTPMHTTILRMWPSMNGI